MSVESLKAAATGGKALKPIDQVKLKIDGIQQQLAKAIPHTMSHYLTADRMTRLFWAEVRKIPKLAECDPNTIAMGLMTAAQLGIEVGVMGQGYLLPYYNKNKKRMDAQFIIGYKGLIALARRSGEVDSIETHIVYANDKFTLRLGIDAKVEHEPHLDGDRGAPKLVYGVAKFKGGGHHFEWMTMLDVYKLRDRQGGKTSGPWLTDFDQMARKTLIRRMANYLPMSIEFGNAITVDDAAAEGKHAAIDGAFAVVDDDSDLTPDDDGDQVEGGQPDSPAASSESKKPEVVKPAAATKAPEKQATGGAASVPTYAQIESKLRAAAKNGDHEMLDVEASMIGTLDNPTIEEELNKLYRQLKAEIDQA